MAEKGPQPAKPAVDRAGQNASAGEPTEAVAKPFTVVDRRFWARGASDNRDDEEKPHKPTYVETLEQRVKEQEEKVNDTLARHRRAVSEFENAQARLRRDLVKEVEQTRRALFVDLLEIVDNLDRAISAADSAADAKALIQGVKMVRQQFEDKLAEYGIHRQQSLGKRFDPREHAAVSTVPVTDPEQDGVVVGVVKEGYVLGDEILRPATVAVGRSPAE
jgi:molecular chaperone GrpE